MEQLHLRIPGHLSDVDVACLEHGLLHRVSHTYAFILKVIDASRGVYTVKAMMSHTVIIHVTAGLIELKQGIEGNRKPIYLHCDPTASHYSENRIRWIVFSVKTISRDELIWALGTKSGYKFHVVQKLAGVRFARKHDSILYYTKGSESFTVQ